MTKKLVWTEVDTFYAEGTVKELVAQLQNYVVKYGDDVRVERCTRMYNDGDYCSVQIQVEETDSQYEHRVAQEKYWAERQEKQEKVELQRLLDKFGPK